MSYTVNLNCQYAPTQQGQTHHVTLCFKTGVVVPNLNGGPNGDGWSMYLGSNGRPVAPPKSTVTGDYAFLGSQCAYGLSATDPSHINQAFEIEVGSDGTGPFITRVRLILP